MGIYELVKGIREEIKKVNDDPDIQEHPLFFLKTLELELNVVVTKAAEAGIKFIVFTAGADYQREEINKIRLKFEPMIVSKSRVLEEEYEGKPIYAAPLTLEELHASKNQKDEMTEKK